MSSHPILATVESIESRVADFRTKMHPDNAAQTIADAVTGLRSKFQSDTLGASIDMTPADIATKYERVARELYDKNLATSAAELSAELRATEGALEAVVNAAASMPHPIDGITARSNSLTPTTEIAVEKLRVTLDLDRIERRFNGRKLETVVKAYAGTNDGRDEAIVWFIESQHAAGWPDVTFEPSRDDAEQMQKLKDLVKERRQARVASNHPELNEARARFAKLKTASLDSQFRHLLSGRKLAAV